MAEDSTSEEEEESESESENEKKKKRRISGSGFSVLDVVTSENVPSFASKISSSSSLKQNSVFEFEVDSSDSEKENK